MSQVPTPYELVTASDESIRPSLSNGSAHALPMSTEEMAAVRKRPIGFVTPHPEKPAAKKKRQKKGRP